MTKQAVLLSLAVVIVAGGAFAQGPAARTVREVRIDGLDRVGEQVVRAQIETQPGQEYSPRAIARDIRRIYKLGYFSIVKVDAVPVGDELTLTYVVEEKRVIERIDIIGNDKVGARRIRERMTWRETDSFMAEAYQEELESLLRLYQEKGFPNARVDIVVEETGPSRVAVSYIIDEGKKARIRSIRVAGNEALSTRALKRIMKTRRAWWFIGGKYDEDKFEDDLRNILETYGDRGRLEARIDGTDFTYRKGGKGIAVFIRITEGAEYTVDSLDVAENVVYDDDEILRLVEVQPGDVHNKSQVREDADLVAKGYSDSGYVDAHVAAQVTLDREDKTTHIVHRVDEGELKYLREIRIRGNTVTRDEVVRREVLLLPGERFDGSLMEASKQRLRGTEYFEEDIQFLRERIEGDEKYENLELHLNEGKTSFWNFGLGYSTEDAFNVYSELQFGNFDITNWPKFSGGGQQLRLRLSLGSRSNQYSLSFTDPEIGGRPLAFGFDIFNESYEYSGGTNYTEDTQGLQLRLGKVLSPYVRVRTSLRYRRVDISENTWSQWSPYERLRGGETTISSIWGINRTKVDVGRDPSSGSKHDLQLEIAGLGGDNHFLKLEHDSTWYWPLTEEEKWVFSYRTREGWAMGYGATTDVPLSDRFFVGGASTVRGYEQRDIGPTERRSWFFGEEDRIGGELRLVNNLELKYKVTDRFRVYTFADAGGVWEEPSAFDLGDVRCSWGVGMGFDIPRMGPIRVDYGIPINADSDQGSGRLHLQTGFRW